MNVKKIFNSIQEKIALDNFKIEIKKNKRKKRKILITASLAVIVAGILYQSVKNSDQNYI